MELTFREMVKLVHPDSNPNITNSGEKMNDVMLNRSNSRALWNLACRWGLVQGQENPNTPVRGNIRIVVHRENVWDTGLRPQRRPVRRPVRRYWEV